MELFKSRLLSEGSIWHIGSLSAVYLSQGLSGGTLFALTTYLVSIGASVKDISLLLSNGDVVVTTFAISKCIPYVYQWKCG